MGDRLAVDTNAVVDLLRVNRPTPQPLRGKREVLVPVVVAGELYAGAFASQQVDQNLRAINELLEMWRVLEIDLRTALVYGEIRAAEQRRLNTAQLTPNKRNDRWVAAACLRHDVPLLPNDGEFRFHRRLDGDEVVRLPECSAC